MATELRFRAMGSDAHVMVVGGTPGSADQARRRVDDLERKWSRFRPDSEISRLNAGAGSFIAVSGDTRLLVETAMTAWRLSGGAFDPTLLGAIIRAGYDRSFDLLGPDVPGGVSRLGAGADDILIEGDAVLLPPCTGFDPGGIGKGLAADLVAAEAMAAGASGVCMNLGGDIRVCGSSPDGNDGWTVALEHPHARSPFALVGVRDGGIATSTTLRRAWQTEGDRRHHLIDPQTGLPSDTDIALATVIAGETWVAEVLAKAVVLHGTPHHFDIIGGTGAESVAVDRSGQVTTSAGFAAFLGPRGQRPDPYPALHLFSGSFQLAEPY